jgi:hypothetical protein
MGSPITLSTTLEQSDGQAASGGTSPATGGGGISVFENVETITASPSKSTNATRLQSLIDQYNNGGGGLILVAGDFEVDSAIELKRGVTLQTHQDSKLKASGDHDLLHVHQGASVQNVRLDCSAVPGYSSDAVRFYSADWPNILTQTKVTNLKVDGLGGTDNRTPRGGRGVVILAEDDAATGGNANGFVSGLVLDDFEVQGFDESIHIEARQNGSDGAFITSCTLSNGVIDWYTKGLVVKGQSGFPELVVSNRFRNLAFQTRPPSEKVLDIQAGSSHILKQLKIWDWNLKHNSAGNDDPSGPAISMGQDTSDCRIEFESGPFADIVDDKGVRNQIINTARDYDRAGSYFQGPMSLSHFSVSPSDNLLHGAEKSPDQEVTVPQGNRSDLINETSVAEAFDHRVAQGLELDNTATKPFQIEVFLGRTFNNVRHILVDFADGRIAEEVTLEVHNAETDTWITVTERPWTDNTGTILESHTENHDRISARVDFADQDNVDKIRITLDGNFELGSNEKTELVGLYAWSTRRHGEATVGLKGTEQNRVYSTMKAEAFSADGIDNKYGADQTIKDFPVGKSSFEVQDRPEYFIFDVTDTSASGDFSEVTEVILRSDHTIPRRLSAGDDFDIIVNNNTNPPHSDNSVSSLSYDGSRDLTTVVLDTNVDLSGIWDDRSDSVEAKYSESSSWPEAFGLVRTQRARFSDNRSLQFFVPNANTDDRHRLRLRRWNDSASSWTEWRTLLVSRHGSSLPAAGSVKAGELFYKTDEDKLYVFNETSGEWEVVGIDPDTPTTFEEEVTINDIDGLTIQDDGDDRVVAEVSGGHGKIALIKSDGAFYAQLERGGNSFVDVSSFGIGTNNPSAAQLDVDGAVQLGGTTTALAGMIRWTGSDFEVYDGTTWETTPLENLAELTDVDIAAQSDGNVLASGGGNYRNESIRSLISDHVDLGDLNSKQHAELANAPTDAHHNRDHQSRHHRGNDDELLVTLLPSGSPSNQNVVLHPDGSGGTRWKIPLDGVSKLSQSISSPPTQTEVQNIQDKVNEVIENLK